MAPPQFIRVLLIEDNRIEARQTQQWLSSAKDGAFEVECVEQLRLGLERLAYGGIDIVLLDLNLPDSRGIETFLKLHDQNLQVPVVVLTGEYDESIGPIAVENGAQDYLLKNHADSASLSHVLLYALVRHRAHLGQLANERHRLNEEMAKAVQMRMLSRSRPTIAGYHFWDYYKAAENIGGDYFGYFEFPDLRIAISIADVVGKGITAALTVAELSSEVRHCLETSSSASVAMSRLNRQFCDRDTFITFSLCILDPTQHTLTVVNAGHAPPLRNSPTPGNFEQLQLSSTALPLGLRSDEIYSAEVFDIGSGDLFLLYTDGVIDEQGPSSECFGSVKLMESLRRAVPAAIEETGQSLLYDLEKFRGAKPQFDDICLIGFSRFPFVGLSKDIDISMDCAIEGNHTPRGFRDGNSTI